MKIKNALVLLLFAACAYSCSLDDTDPEPIIPEPTIGPYASIAAGNTENAYHQIVNDTISSIGMANTMDNKESKTYDLNNDGIDDVTFTTDGGGGASAWGVVSYFLPLDKNETVQTSCRWGEFESKYTPVSFEKDSIIDNRLSFTPYTSGGFGYTIASDGNNLKMNCWGNDVFKYIAVKINNADTTSYAWIKVAVNTSENRTSTYIESYGSRQ